MVGPVLSQSPVESSVIVPNPSPRTESEFENIANRIPAIFTSSRRFPNSLHIGLFHYRLTPNAHRTGSVRPLAASKGSTIPYGHI
jgi:hypothetical protein